VYEHAIILSLFLMYSAIMLLQRSLQSVSYTGVAGHTGDVVETRAAVDE